MMMHLNDGNDYAYCKSVTNGLTADPREATCAECHSILKAKPFPAIDGERLVHLTWFRGDGEVFTSLCSTITDAIRVMPCEQAFANCLRCIDIVDRFW